MNDDAAIQDIHRKIDRENNIINAANTMLQASANTAVNSRLESQIREARRNIQYFQQTLQGLQQRQMTSGMSHLSMAADNSGGPRPPRHGGPGGSMGASGHPVGDQSAADRDAANASGLEPPNRPFAASSTGPRARPNYSKLDLIKYDTPHLGPRIQLMLSQLEFKLSVEKQYKDGIEKMEQLFKMEGDRKSRQETEVRKMESNQKIQLLTRALRRYGELHVDVENGADMADDDSLDTPSQRKPLTGRLTVKVQAVADVDHTATGRFSRGPDTFVIMKVEDAFKARTRATKTDRWTEETHVFDVDKANEVEFTVYDKSSSDHPIPIGMLWIRLSDLVDELRRKKIETEFNQAGWITADKMEGQRARPDLQFLPPPGSHGAAPGPQAAGGFSTAAAAGGPAGSGLVPQTGPVFTDSWFSLEPVGRIHLSLGFVKQTGNRKQIDVGLNRKGAVRQKKEDVVEQFGHKFTQQMFYNIMRCAFCGDFLKYTAGMQCSDCKFTCHKSCCPKVVIKCISKSNSETDPDEEKISHRIPHRFEPFSNMGANWCCHCGYMLPLGKRQSRKCNECKLTCHYNCMHFVPDFCGITMDSANQIYKEIVRTKGHHTPVNSSGNISYKPKRPAAPAGEVSYAQQSGSETLSQASEKHWSYSDQAPPTSSSSNAAGSSTSSDKRTSGFGSPLASPESSSTSSRPSAQRLPSDAALAAQAALRGSTTSASSSSTTPRYGAPSGSGYLEKKTLPSTPQGPTPLPYNPQDFANIPGFPPSPYASAPIPSMSATVPMTSPQPPSIPQYQPQNPHMQMQQQTMAPLASPPPPSSPPAQASPSTAPAAPQPPSTPVTTTSEVRKPAPPANHPGTGRRIGLENFNFLAVLGKGNFGKVMLAETKTTKQLYAIKVLKKEFIIENDEIESTRSEKRVHLIANKERHPFLLNLHACFQTETRIYFVTEYISGGDLMLHIQRGQFGARRAQFYAAEVCLALKYFHENGVIYRDLKLDNILLTLDGHIKVADYGLCKEDMWYGSTTSTFCGTPEFMAPEILLDKKYGRAVDWWAFGVLIYQMLLQQSPFRGEDEDEIYDAILADEPLYPIHMPRDSVSILQKLLTREPELRLGSGPTDAQEIMSHAFFRNINWEDIYFRRVPVPFVPTVKSRVDTSNFDNEFTSVTPVLTPVQSVLSQAMQEEFRGFSYSADFV